jgi:hypothetical protein
MHAKACEDDSLLLPASGFFKAEKRRMESIVIPAVTSQFFVHEHFSAGVRPQNLREVPLQFLEAFEGFPVPIRSARYIRRHVVAQSVSAESAVRSFEFPPHIDAHALWCLLMSYGGLQGLVAGNSDLRLNTFLLEDRHGKDRFVYLSSQRRLLDLYIDSMPGRELLLDGDAVFVATRAS